jgi:hypothetical protein
VILVVSHMKAATLSSVFGILMLLLCALCGVVSSAVMCGMGMCGWVALSLGACLFAAFTALFPAGTVSFLRAPWWLSPLVFSVLMLIPNKCQSSLLTLPGRADKGLPCRASYALSILGPCITS